jgi:Tfp pilus assembly protein PilF
MTVAVVYELAVAEGLEPIAGAAPFEVLARQVPRLLVARLNGRGDRGVRFFPFLGNQGGQRRFLVLREMLPAETLARMHRQGEVACIVDGRIHGGGLRLRIVDGPTLRERFDDDLPFDPRSPLATLRRVEFEVMSALAWDGAPAPGPTLSGEALAWYLVAKDALLALEAGLHEDGSFDPLRAARRCAGLEPGDGHVRTLVLEMTSHLLRRDALREPAIELLADLAERAHDAPDFVQQAADLLLAAGHGQRAAAILLRSARDWPAHAAVVHQASALLFRQGRLQEARAVLRDAVAAGNAATTLLAQLAGIEDLLGDRAARDELCRRILAAGEPPPTVTRLLVAFLLEQRRPAEALVLLERALERSRDDAALWLERGRTLLLLERVGEAQVALARSLELEPAPPMRREAERLLRVGRVPGLPPALQSAENAVKEGRLRDGLRVLRGILRADRSCAEPWLLLGIVRQKLAHPRRAERALRRAIELQPELADAHNRLGILLVARGRAAQGLGHLLQALALLPGESSVRVHLAQACALLGRRREGEEHLAEAERLGASPATLDAVRRGFFGAGA